MGYQSLIVIATALLAASVGCDASLEIKPDPPPKVTTTETKSEPASTAAPKPDRVSMDKPVEQVEVGGYLSGVAAAHRSARERIEALPVIQAIQFWHAEHGRYPKSHEEFMEKCWKPLQTPLPKIESGFEYRYFPEDHTVYKVPVGYEAKGDQ